MKKKLLIRNGYLIVFLLILGLMGYKSLHGLEKVSAYEKAERFYGKERYTEAEKYYSQVHNNRWFSYKEGHTQAMFQELTNMKEKISAYILKTNAAYQNGEFQDLIDLYEDFTIEKNAYADDPIFLHFVQSLQVDHIFASHFSSIIQDSLQTIDNNMQDHIFKEESFYQVLDHIPSKFYGNKKQKTKQLTKIYEKYDQAKYQYLENTLNFTNLTTDMENQLRLYQDLSIDAQWLKLSLTHQQTEHDKEEAIREEQRIQQENERIAADEAEKANDEAFQQEIMTVVNDYVTSWVSAYNHLDSSYFVNITPELHSSLDQQLQIFISKGAAYIGELQQTTFDLDSFTYHQLSNMEQVDVKLEIFTYSAVYLENEDYELAADTKVWLYTLTNSGEGWKLSARKQLNGISYSHTKIFDFESDYSDD